MKTTHAVILNEWVTNNKSYLSSGSRGTLQDCATKASAELSIKVSSSALRELMQSQGIDTKRLSARQSEKLSMLGEIEKLNAEVMELRRTLAKVAASDYVPEEIKDFVFAGLKEEVKTAIFSAN
jgi:SMC interacting uncharacterized protein involved in chromosome segregation|tara:strand:- start:605 stop:976 length:372 start_codon:yes stop_codon:yes gene_type:complete